MSFNDSNGVAAVPATAEAEAPGNRPYVVLEQGTALEIVRDALDTADVGLSAEEWDRLRQLEGQVIYRELSRVPSRNAAHALMQVGRTYSEGATPPLVAVSERMFRPRPVNVTLDARVSLK